MWSDEFLLKELQGEGGKDAFDVLFHRYYPMLCAYGQRFVSLPEAEEIAEDTLMWLWEHRSTPIMPGALGSYLLKTVYHKALNTLRQNEARGASDTRFYEEHLLNEMTDGDFARVNELSQHIRQAIASLPPAYREAFTMHRFKNMSYKEIAEVLQVSDKTVEYRITQALKILRKELQDYLPLLSGWLFM